MTATVEIEQWPWRDVNDHELLVGQWVRTAPLITCMPTAHPKLYSPGERVLDYGIVYELLENGGVKIQWSLSGNDTHIRREDPCELELSSKEIAEAFAMGENWGYERGLMRGRQQEVNDLRARIGLPVLDDTQWESLVEQGDL